MNKVLLVGRITKDVEIRMTSNQTPYCNFTIAVDRRFKDANGQRQVDFINCAAWKQTATFIQQYFRKGSRIGIEGNIQTRSYEDKDQVKHFVTEVIIDAAEFVESTTAPKQEAPQEPHEAPKQDEPVGELPFEI